MIDYRKEKNYKEGSRFIPISKRDCSSVDINDVSFLVFKRLTEEGKLVTDIAPFWVAQGNYTYAIRLIDPKIRKPAGFLTATSEKDPHSIYVSIADPAPAAFVLAWNNKSSCVHKEGYEEGPSPVDCDHYRQYYYWAPHWLNRTKDKPGKLFTSTSFKKLIGKIENEYKCKNATPEFAEMCKKLKKTNGNVSYEELQSICKDVLNCVSMAAKLEGKEITAKKKIESFIGKKSAKKSDDECNELTEKVANKKI